VGGIRTCGIQVGGIRTCGTSVAGILVAVAGILVAVERIPSGFRLAGGRLCE
jgi:ABC-type uncharacterized transport system permease subunit